MSSQFQLDALRVAGSGHWFIGVAGGTLASREVVYMDANGRYQAADADSAATMPCMGITLSAATVGQNVMILTRGFVSAPSGPWTAGNELYVSTVPGAITHTAPGPGDITQQIGIAYTTTQIWFDPEGEGVGVAAGCPILEGSTAYVGFDSCKEPFTNYFYCDGTADEVQINAAEAYVTALGGGTVELERGTYDIADPIIPTGNNIWYKGQGEDTFLDGDNLATTEHVFHVTGRDDVQISDMSMQTEDGAGKTCYCIFIEDGSDRFKIRNVSIIESDVSGIHVTGTTIDGGIIDDCRVFGADGDGIGVYMDAQNYMYRLHITGCDITGCGANGIDGATCAGNNYWVIEENTVYACTAYGIFLRDGDHSIISNNTSYNNEWNGIYVIDSDHVIINDNDSYYNGRMGIYLHNTSDSLVEGNLCIENDRDNTNTYDGIYADGDSNDNIILGNKCNDNDRYGINVAGARNIVKDNDFSGNTSGAFNDAGTDTATHELNVTVENTNANIGRHPVAQMLDDVETTVRFGFTFPMEFHEIVTVQVVVVPGGTGDLVWDAFTDYGEICATQDYNAHSDSVGATTTGVTINDLECLDVSAALNVAAPVGGDRVGMEFWRYGDNGSDTVDATVYAVEVRLRYV